MAAAAARWRRTSSAATSAARFSASSSARWLPYSCIVRLYDAEPRLTSRMIVLYGLALVPVTLLPVGLGLAGSVYLAGAVGMGLAFLSYCVSCAVSKERQDARKLFFASIVYLPLLFAVMMIDKV